jgi:DNA polymerase elongation subunit (family B)
MYRNCVYEQKSKSIHLWTWDASGNRVKQEIPFSPYLHLEDKSGKDRSIYGTPLKKKSFETQYERGKFIKESGITRIFENLPAYQQFLVDDYYRNCHDDDFAQFPLKVCFLDIECPSNPTIKNGAFPDPEFAEQVVNLIVCHDGLGKKKTIFGLKAYAPKNPDIKYHHCKSEHDLLKRFIGYISSDFPDVLCGYNSNNFDIPYLINRITFELGKEWADELSPIGRIYEKINNAGKFGQPSKEYVIEGISCLDYYVMYMKFNMEKQQSYKLDAIGELEVGVNKIDFKGSLWDLARDDWGTYVDYCIRDVDLVVKLDEKLDYISLLRFLAYTGLCSLENAIKTLPCMNGAIAIQARERGELIPTFIKPVTNYKAPGGYVSDPIIGFSKNIVSFDANSLYPSVMISLNLSPETKIGRVEQQADKINIYHVSGRTFELSKENFLKYITEEKAALSKSGHLFSQKRVGIVPEFLDMLYTKRKEMKARMVEAKKRGDKEAAQKFDTIQYAYKIHLNSLYGYMLNKYAPMGDEDIGTSVTMTGQAAIKESNKLFLQFLDDACEDSNNIKKNNSIIYNDTDSIYTSLQIFEDYDIPLKGEDGMISPEFYALCDKIENYINEGMTKWAIKSLRSTDPRFVFKREAICDSGIFIGKKYYVLHNLDDEGIPVDKFKYKGVDVVKTTMPKVIKPHIKKIIEHMILSQNLQETNKLFNEAYEIFKTLPIENICKISGMNNFEKYSKLCSGIQTAPKMPFALKAAYHHDYIMEKLNLVSKYQKFKSGDKVRSVYVKSPNKYNLSVIGFREEYPEEFKNIFQVDYEKMFDKMVFAAIQRFYEVVNWKLRKPNENLKIELEDFLS